MSPLERQANARDEGTPADPSAQKLPTVAPGTEGRDDVPAEPMPRTMEDKPQVRGKGPAGRERSPRPTTNRASRPAAAKDVSPRQRPKKAAAKRKAAKPAGARTGAKKGGRKKASAKKAPTKKAPARKVASKRPAAKKVTARGVKTSRKSPGNVRGAVARKSGQKTTARPGGGVRGKRHAPR